MNAVGEFEREKRVVAEAAAGIAESGTIVGLRQGVATRRLEGSTRSPLRFRSSHPAVGCWAVADELLPSESRWPPIITVVLFLAVNVALRMIGYPIGYPRHFAARRASRGLTPINEKLLISRAVSDGETRTRTGDTTIFRESRYTGLSSKHLQIDGFEGSKSS
jgi:hypothetical protein